MKNYHGHNTRASWSLLGYKPRYRSFNKRRGTEGESLVTVQGGSREQVTLAVPVGRLIESCERASSSRSDPALRPPEPSPRLLHGRGDESLSFPARKRKKRKRYCAGAVPVPWWRTWKPWLLRTRPQTPLSLLVMLRLRLLPLFLSRPLLPPFLR